MGTAYDTNIHCRVSLAIFIVTEIYLAIEKSTDERFYFF